MEPSPLMDDYNEYDDLEMDELEEEVASNRTFLIAAGTLSALIFVVALVALLYLFVFRSDNGASPAEQTNEAILQTNTAVILHAEQTNEAQLAANQTTEAERTTTAVAMVQQTETAAAIPTETPTPVPTDTPDTSPTPVVRSPTPTPDVTAMAQQTETALAKDGITNTPKPSPTRITTTPQAGLGGLEIALAAAVLVVVLVVVRRLRLAT